jgi:FkbM family methyltransferase
MNSLVRRVIRERVPRPIRNWLKSPRQSCQWLQEALRYRVGSSPRLQLRSDWTLRCHPTVARFIRANQLSDPSQRRELDDFIASITRKSTLFDIGAHFGVFSLAALHFGGREVRVVAVDPSPTAVRMMRIQAQLNGIDFTQLQIIQAAMGKQIGRQQMVSVGVIGGGYFVAPEKTHSGIDFTETLSLTIDELAARNQMSPTHLKIDVEGAEHAVLRGAMKTLSRSAAPTVFLELHNALIRRRGEDPGQVVRSLESFGYIIRNAGNRDAMFLPDVVRLVASKAS